MHIPPSEGTLYEAEHADGGPPVAALSWALLAKLYHPTFDPRPTNSWVLLPLFYYFILFYRFSFLPVQLRYN